MNLQLFFKNYPKAKLLAVGDKYYLTSAFQIAQSAARKSGDKIKKISAEDIDQKDTESSEQLSNTSTKNTTKKTKNGSK